MRNGADHEMRSSKDSATRPGIGASLRHGRGSLRAARRTGAAACAALLALALPGAAAGPDARAVAARVGGQPIFLGEILEGASSLALVGKENVGDQPGTRERLLERLITARLLYLDGRDRRLDRSERYREDLRAFADPILATRYVERLRAREAPSREDPAVAKRGRAAREELEARTRAIRTAEVEHLRARTRIVVRRDALDPALDTERGETAVVATVGDTAITWRRVRRELAHLTDVAQREERLERTIDAELLAAQARRVGLDAEASFRAMVEGFEQRELVALVREEIERREGLDAAGVRREYEAHLANFTLPEQRRVQQIVVRTRAEANEVLDILRSPPPGASFYTLARERSIDPRARRTLGVLGWLTLGDGSPPITEAAFSLAPGRISGPIETEAGLHLVRVIGVRPQQVVPLDADTERRIRARWNANRVADYAKRLAERTYGVELYPDVYRLPQPSAPASDRS